MHTSGTPLVVIVRVRRNQYAAGCMDPVLRQLIGGEREELSLVFTFLVDGVVVIGTPSHPSRWVENASAMLDQITDAGHDPLPLQWLRPDPAAVEGDEYRYAILRDVTLLIPPRQRVDVSAIRLDLERVAAWWIRSPSTAIDLPDD